MWKGFRNGEWTPDQARHRAEDLRQIVRGGHDPLTEKAPPKAVTNRSRLAVVA
jgi:hypothetical protein